MLKSIETKYSVISFGVNSCEIMVMLAMAILRVTRWDMIIGRDELRLAGQIGLPEARG